MRVHFTYNDGDGHGRDEPPGCHKITAAKREALLFLAQSLQDSVETTGFITGAVSGLDTEGAFLFSVSMNVTFEDAADQKAVA